ANKGAQNQQQSQNTPTIQVNHHTNSSEDVSNRFQNTDNPPGYFLNSSLHPSDDFSLHPQGLSSQIPIKREKSFSANNLCDPDLQFQRFQNFPRFPRTLPQFHDRSFMMNSPYNFNHYPYHQFSTLPTQPEIPEPETFLDDRNFYQPVQIDHMNPTYYEYQHEPFHSDRYRTYRQPFESNWSTNFTHPVQQGSNNQYQIPTNDNQFNWHDQNRNILPQKERLLRRRDSSEPPNISSRDELHSRSQLNRLEQNVNNLLNDPRQYFDINLKSQLINFVNFMKNKIEKDGNQQQWQISVQNKAEDLLLKLAEFELSANSVVPLPYEHLPERPSAPSESSESKSYSHEAELSPSFSSKRTDFDNELDRLSEWMQNSLSIQCNEFIEKSVKDNGSNVDHFNREHQYLQDQITKALCKCDAISGKSLPAQTRQRRKDTVKSLEDMASKLDSHHRFNTSAFVALVGESSTNDDNKAA
ncbi:hypothetical protein GJ496_003568, partial [Pomphorhynchus laevis]